ncbi:hypothetical protein SMD20_33695 [Nonomuraea sp. LP-02]|uniref:hypothetical protein n=1 Tax=Nonomuraea sp. LP-02 TaxID=3097960 RepID=UPI002E31CD1F|nr:hypothetical protein [Nonomuraea sp. LP-02]MED7929240.1 hypothetical protein [Nonomuraea sp. LP-02]
MFTRVVLAIAATAAAVGWTLTATVPAVVDIGLATGLTGAPGTLTVLECHDGGSSRHSRQVCTGSFVYDATGEKAAVRAFSWADPGHVYPAQITNGGDRAGVRGTQGALAALVDLSIGLIFITAVGIALGLRAFRLASAAVIGAVGLVGIAVGTVAQSV